MKVGFKLIAFCSLVLFGISSAFASDTEVKTKVDTYATYNTKYFSSDGFQQSFAGSIGAVSGEIVERQPGPDKKPLIKIKLSGIEKSLWIATTVEVLDSQLLVGNEIDVLGFFDETKNETQYVSKITDDTEYLLGFCFNIKPSGVPVFNPYLLKRCLDWENGNLNLNLPHKNIQR